MELEAGDVVLAITWHPAGLGSRNGVARVMHLDGRDDRREMSRRQCEELVTSVFGSNPAVRELTGQSVEWTRGAG